MVLDELQNLLISFQYEECEDIHYFSFQICAKKGLWHFALLGASSLEPYPLHVFLSEGLLLVEHGHRRAKINITILLLHGNAKCGLHQCLVD